jgi:hypothetical protein
MCKNGIVCRKYNFERATDVDFVVALMESNSESIGVLDTTIVSKCCMDIHKQQVVYCDKVFTMLRDFLEGSLTKKDMAMGLLRKIGWTKKCKAEEKDPLQSCWTGEVSS